MYLSKSKYCLLVNCPKQLWLESNRQELKKEDAARESVMETGNEVGDLAMGYFGDFTEVTTMKSETELDIPEMIRKTKACMDGGVENICEASFSYQGLYCAVDILHKQDGGYAIYEVKSASEEKVQYGADIAYQKYVLEHCGVQVTGTYLLHLNKNYIRGEELDLKGLFTAVDMAKEVADHLPLVPGYLDLAEKTLAGTGEPDCELDMCCHKPYPCPYFDYCRSHISWPSVFDLPGMHFDVKLEHYRNGLGALKDLQEKVKLPPSYRHWSKLLVENTEYIDKKGIQKFVDTVFYPLYFLDFESFAAAIPLYPGTYSRQNIVFQYSLHSLEHADAALEHREFLAQPGVNPLRELAESLCRDIPKDACVIVYNKGFERGRINELADMFPDLSEHLKAIWGNIRDIYEPFQKGYYYNSAMWEKRSIKNVLPALFPGDPELDYHNLDGVQNGTQAMTAFPRMDQLSPEQQQQLRTQLLAYCKLDTYATVKLWRKLLEVSKP